MKLMVMGFARHGKDTVCEILQERYGLSFVSSSLFAAEEVVYPILKKRYGYTSVEECFEDRYSHRDEWFNLIKGYGEVNGKDALTKRIFEECDIYCGIRNHHEFLAARDAELFDLAIWVDASKRKPAEDSESCSVSPYMADLVLDNNGSMEDLVDNTIHMMRHIESTIKQKKLKAECIQRYILEKS